MPITKVCTKCGEEKPATEEYFYLLGYAYNGLYSICKECHKKRSREYYINHPGKGVSYNKKYREAHREVIQDRQQRWSGNNKDKKVLYNKKYRESHRSRISEKNKEYRLNNLDKITESNRKWRENKRGDYLAIAKKSQHKRRAAKNKLPTTLTAEQWETIKNVFNGKCAYCGEEVKLEQEHFVALSNGGEYTHNNIVPACRICNRSKSNKDFFEWYPQQKFYSKKREQKILKFLNYKNGKQQLSLLI